MAAHENRPRVPYTFGALYDLLLEYFPDHRTVQKVFDIPGLAKDLGLAHETIYRCVRENRLKPGVAEKLLTFSRERHPEQALYWNDIARFVLPGFEEFTDHKKPFLR